MPDDEPGNNACCLPDDNGTECQDLAAAECTAAGGQPSTAASCVPNPCGGSVGGAFIACCQNDDEFPNPYRNPYRSRMVNYRSAS